MFILFKLIPKVKGDVLKEIAISLDTHLDFSIIPYSKKTRKLYQARAVYYVETKQWVKGEQAWAELVELAKKTYGVDHHIVALQYNQLGLLKLKMGKYQEAEQSLKSSFDASKAVNENQRTSFGNLGWALLLQGKESENYFEQGLSPNHTPEQWQYHWRRLGLELSRFLKGVDVHQAQAHLRELEVVLGADHERVEMAKTRFERVKSLKDAPKTS